MTDTEGSSGSGGDNEGSQAAHSDPIGNSCSGPSTVGTTTNQGGSIALKGAGGCSGGARGGQGEGAVPEVSKTAVRQQLAFVSACYPSACPSRGMLRQTFNFAKEYREAR